MATTIGTTISKAWPDGTGANNQSHLVYAENANVWWLFSLDSTADVARVTHVIHAYYSSGPNLATATWTAATDVPDFAPSDSNTSQICGGGRALGCLYLKNGSTDVIHLRCSVAQDGQNGDNNHLRGVLGKTSITWGSWLTVASPGASEWKGPVGTGLSGLAACGAWGDVLVASVGKYINSFGGAQDFEIDMNVMRSTNNDTGAAWTNDWDIIAACGPTGNVAPMCMGKGSAAGNRPPSSTIDGTMLFECKVAALAPLAGDEMLAVYSSGAVAQPDVSNLRSQRSLPCGLGNTQMWTDQSPGNSFVTDGIDMGPSAVNNGVFATDVTHNQNDWCMAAVDLGRIYVCRRGSATQVDVVQFGQSPTVVASGPKAGKVIADKFAWSATPTQPPALTGKTIKAATTNVAGLGVSGGLFCATNGVDFWLFVIDTTDSAIKYTRYDVSAGAWDAWQTATAVAASAAFLAGFQKVASNQIGLIWTEANGSNYDTKVTSLVVPYEAPVNLAAARTRRRRRSS